MIDYEDIEREYLTPKYDDDDRIREIRERMRTRLTLAERKIMIYYMELGTYTEVAKILHCSVPTVSKKIREIREKLTR